MPQSGSEGRNKQFYAPIKLLPQVRSVGSIASLYLFRMLGLFMVLPVLVLYGQDYRGSTPLLLGIALGAYGFSQALLQIPFGWWSDRWGRRPVIALGLVLFALGSLVAAVSDSVYGLICGRFIQGAGAIASALMALVADSTEEQHRSKAMAFIGVSIGLSFSIALILGPVIAELAGLSGIFWLNILLALAGLLVLFTAIPAASPDPTSSGVNAASIKEVLQHKELLRLDWGILVLHLVLMANFVAIPGLLESVVELDRADHWRVYLSMLVAAFVVMIPIMLLGERRGKLKPIFLGAISALAVVESLLAVAGSHAGIILVCLFTFFVAFNLLEVSLPSQVSKMAPNNARGTASGVYSSSQFFGAFAGGTLGGAALSVGGATAVFALNTLVLVVWLIVAWPMVISRRIRVQPAPLFEPECYGDEDYSDQTKASETKIGKLSAKVELESV